MIEIRAKQVTIEIRSLFHAEDPAALRCDAVLNGDAAGRIWIDSRTALTWGIVQEAAFGSLYLGGLVNPSVLHSHIHKLRKTGDVLVGLWHKDPRFELLPSDPEYDGITLDFTNRPSGYGLDEFARQIPDGFKFEHVDGELFECLVNRDLYYAMFGSRKAALEKGLGIGLFKGDEIVCEAFAAPCAAGIIEIGTETNEKYRGLGYATLTCARLIKVCELLGYKTYWNCARQNLASAALARKLGYRTEKEYRLLAWYKKKVKP